MNVLKIALKPCLRKIAGLILILMIALPGSAWAAAKAPHWSYGGADNPTQWGELDNNFELCKTGTKQSPINLEGATQGEPSSLVFNYQDTPLTVVNNGHTIQINYAPGSTAEVEGETYELLQLHFHTPSEHEIGGKAFPMELHLVHRNAAGKLAVVGVMMAQGVKNSTIEQIWAHLPTTNQTLTVKDVTVNAADLLPANKAYFSYLGSLTTPPCSEQVKWQVLKEPIAVSSEQIAAFGEIYQVNARPVQPMRGRSLELHGNA